MAIGIAEITDQESVAASTFVRTGAERVFEVTDGMDVRGVTGTLVGRLKEVRRDDILVHRALRRDVYVPFDAIKDVRDGCIVLAVPEEQVDAMDWPHPPLLAL